MKKEKLELLKREYNAFLKLESLQKEYDNEKNMKKKHEINIELIRLHAMIPYFSSLFDFNSDDFFVLQSYIHRDDEIDDTIDKIYFLYAAYRDATKEEIYNFSHLNSMVRDKYLMPTTMNDKNLKYCEYWNLESANDKIIIPIKECKNFTKSHHVIYRNNPLYGIEDMDEDEYIYLCSNYYKYIVEGYSQEQIINKMCLKK